jgi:hypothetical protein
MKPLSFSQRLNAGWTKAELMRYYALNEGQYQKVLNCLDRITQEKAKV